MTAGGCAGLALRVGAERLTSKSA